ncbi:MAG TPA: PASTA domain-containing protein [Syntrophales bacterium]|nr:PASTA domain-containing protein [Syntrophales bacterium]
MMRFFKGLGIFLALVGIGVASAFTVIVLLLRQEEVRVPDLAGRDIVSAMELATQQGLLLKVDRREPHPSMPRDTVISQEPPPGSGIKKGRQIRLVVSQGPSELLAPKVAGENFRKADIMIRQAGFVPGDLSRAFSETVERDTVMAQYPQAGSQLEKGGTITLLVSSGRKPELFVMPRLTGSRAAEALRTLDRMGLQHRIVTQAPGGRSAGGERTVISQKPGAGYPVSADATVELVVSK